MHWGKTYVVAAVLLVAAVLAACASVPPPGGAPPGELSISGTVRIAGAPAASMPGGEVPEFRTFDRNVADPSGLPQTVPGEVIVKFKNSLSPQSLTTLQAAGLELQLVRSLQPVSLRLYRTQATTEAETQAVVEALNRRDDVLYAQPNYLYRYLAVPDDPYNRYQWHYGAMNLPQAWDLTTGSSSTVVAVLDSGILFDPSDPASSHPDFDPGRMLLGYDFVSDLANANDGDGRDADPYDNSSEATTGYHGSHVAGTIGAWSNNGVGVTGIDWQARVLNVRVGGMQGVASFDALEAAWWAAGGDIEGVPGNGTPASVLNMSFGGQYVCPPAEQDVYDQLFAAGVIIVVAAGNENQDANNLAPANCSGVITVGATDPLGNRAYYSNYGSRIDVLAPGGDLRADLDQDGFLDGVLSTVMTDGFGFDYAFFEGTSMAAPHVAGLIALMKGLDPTLTNTDALAVLQSTSRPLSDTACHNEGAGPTEPDRILTGADCGAGLADAHAALLAVGNQLPPPPTGPDFTLSPSPSSLTLEPGQSASVTVTVNATGGFNQPVVLDLTGAPAGVSFAFSPNPATASATLTLTAAADTLVGTYELVIGGTSGTLSRTAPLTLAVATGAEVPDIAGTIVEICRTSDAPDCDPVQHVTVDANGNFRATGLSSGSYEVYAWKDVNGNGAIDGGDYLGAYLDAGGNIAQVTPPASGLVIELELITDIPIPAGTSAASGFWRLESRR